MTDFASLLVPDRDRKNRLIHLVDKGSFTEWAKRRPPEDRALLEAQRFDGKTAGAFSILPRGNDFEVVAAVKHARALSPWCLAALSQKLPEGNYKLADCEPGKAALGWLLAQHRFDDLPIEGRRPQGRLAHPRYRRGGEDRGGNPPRRSHRAGPRSRQHACGRSGACGAGARCRGPCEEDRRAAPGCRGRRAF